MLEPITGKLVERRVEHKTGEEREHSKPCFRARCLGNECTVARPGLHSLSRPSFNSIPVPHGSVTKANPMPYLRYFPIGSGKFHTTRFELFAERRKILDLKTDMIQRPSFCAHGRAVDFREP